MNYVNLIGRMSSDPVFTTTEEGKKLAQFSMATVDQHLDSEGNWVIKTNWHRVSAWGKWVQILESLGRKGLNLAIEGKLVSRFYQTGKRKVSVTEIHINELIIME